MNKIITLLAIVVVTNCQLLVQRNSPQQLDSDSKPGLPIFAPDKCPEDQLLYPGKQKDDWICDCGPGFLYYAPKDKCFKAYLQGPCSRGYHLIYQRNRGVLECVSNPCKNGYVRYRGKCYEMGKPNGPCPPIERGGGIFDVNATTLIVECLQGTNLLSLFNVPPNCPAGSKRDVNNKCQENWNV